MSILKSTKYLKFEAYTIKGRKTALVKVINKASDAELGEIQWYGPWRQYCFMPTVEFDTVWNNTCLADVIAVIDMLGKMRITDKPKGE